MNKSRLANKQTYFIDDRILYKGWKAGSKSMMMPSRIGMEVAVVYLVDYNRLALVSESSAQHSSQEMHVTES